MIAGIILFAIVLTIALGTTGEVAERLGPSSMSCNFICEQKSEAPGYWSLKKFVDPRYELDPSDYDCKCWIEESVGDYLYIKADVNDGDLDGVGNRELWAWTLTDLKPTDISSSENMIEGHVDLANECNFPWDWDERELTPGDMCTGDDCYDEAFSEGCFIFATEENDVDTDSCGLYGVPPKTAIVPENGKSIAESLTNDLYRFKRDYKARNTGVDPDEVVGFKNPKLKFNDKFKSYYDDGSKVQVYLLNGERPGHEKKSRFSLKEGKVLQCIENGDKYSWKLLNEDEVDEDEACGEDRCWAEGECKDSYDRWRKDESHMICCEGSITECSSSNIDDTCGTGQHGCDKYKCIEEGDDYTWTEYEWVEDDQLGGRCEYSSN